MKLKRKTGFVISPFSLVLFLTVLCLVFSVLIVEDKGNSLKESIQQTLGFWQQGFFGLLDFTLQMMIILVFGYALAIYKPIHSVLKRIAKTPKNASQAVFLTAGITMLAGLLNWGFGLIIGALLARFVFLAMEEKGVRSDPVLLAVAGYLGMAVWHGGLSASAPLKVAEEGHFLQSKIGVISVSDTIFSSFNIWGSGGLILVFLLVLAILAQKKHKNDPPVYSQPLRPIDGNSKEYTGFLLGGIMILVVINQLFYQSVFNLGFLNLNMVNFLLFASTLLAYRGVNEFTEAVSEGLKSSSDIFIQFPFYAGILGMVTHSGVLESTVGYFMDNSSSSVFPVFALVSSAVVNFMVPSGGGQWAVQGPILMEISDAMGLSSSKTVMVFSLGDQISNLLQPFWALPLLAITGISAKQLLKYGFWLFLAGFSYLMLYVYLFF